MIGAFIGFALVLLMGACLIAAFVSTTRCGWCGREAVGRDQEGGAVCRGDSIKEPK